MHHNPMWKTNLAICVTIVALVGGYFLYQVHTASEQFRKNSRDHSRVLAAAVELNIRNAMLSNDGLEQIITDFLKNSARFISYLNVIEQFTASELSAFARETGLAGITIVTDGGASRVEGPENWGPELTCSGSTSLEKHREDHLYSLVYAPGAENSDQLGQHCVIVGFSAGEVELVQKNISVETLLERLSRLPGIAAVQLIPVRDAADEPDVQLAKLVERDGQRFTETRIRISDSDLIVIQQAGHFAKRLHQMRTEFFIFVAFLAVFGASSSWWLYHAERLRLREAREYDQEIARQHEEAALGRAAATIAHEIRNPLNAIGMGLQRLQLETDGLAAEHHALLVSMREAVSRSNSIVTSLQQYVGSFEVSGAEVDIASLLRNVMQLYAPVCAEQGIEVVLALEDGYTVPGDSRLLGQVFENVIKNAVEAQPHGGYCRISLQWSDAACSVVLENGGFTLSEEESGHLFEPYFTTKTKGTGLGLAISKKIVEAHSGRIEVRPDVSRQELALTIELPR